MKKIDIQITHKNCTDGAFAAIAVKHYHTINELPQPEIMYYQYGMKMPELDYLRGKTVLITDFSFTRNDILAMRSVCDLTVIDHHKTAEANLEGLDYCIFDMSKSSAVLTWEYMFPDTLPPTVFDYVQDRDIWTWKLPFSKEVSNGLTLVKDIINIDTEILFSTDFINNMISDGSVVDKLNNKIIDKKLKNMIEINIEGYTVNCMNNTHLISEVGHEMIGDNAFSAQYFFTEKEIVFSLRANDDGVDVSHIAKAFGGGGHANAGGFSIPLDTFDYHEFFVNRILLLQ